MRSISFGVLVSRSYNKLISDYNPIHNASIDGSIDCTKKID